MLAYDLIELDLGKMEFHDEELVCRKVEHIAHTYNLVFKQRMKLSTKKGSYHWHFKKPIDKGVLEVTYWPSNTQFCLEIHDNRRTDWNLKLIEELAYVYSSCFGGRVKKRGVN